jgi:hypothetical protein
LGLIFVLSDCHSSSPIRQTIKNDSKELHCQETYSKFYQKDTLDFRIVFGYKDARPARYVGDRYEAAYFIQKLLDYGFVRSKKNEEEFFYHVKGPDQKEKEIKLLVVSSSAGPDDDENRKDPFQKWKSAHAEDIFLTGLKRADLVFYYGHSRDGGGPDFSYPKLTENHHVDYGWYLRNKPGLQKMKLALRESRPESCAIGLYSCVSDRLFSGALREVKPNISLMTSNALLYYMDALTGMMDTLTDILEMKCQPDFKPAGTQVANFFVGELNSAQPKASGHAQKKPHRDRWKRLYSREH